MPEAYRNLEGIDTGCTVWSWHNRWPAAAARLGALRANCFQVCTEHCQSLSTLESVQQMAQSEGVCKAHVSVLHLRDDLQIPLGGVCQVALLCSVGIDARAILRPSVIALPVLHAGVDLPPEDLQEVLVCHQRRVVRHLPLLVDSAPVSAKTLGRSS